MKKLTLLWVIYLAVCLPIQAQTITKIYLLRHADRAPAGDDLNALGLARANHLKRYLAPTKINALFDLAFITSDSIRSPTEASITVKS